MRLSDRKNTAPVPFRDSKLTRVLRPALEGNTKVAVICNISPSNDAVEESLSTLNFAKRAKKVRQIVAKNETISTKMLILKYETEINSLQLKLKEMETKVTSTEQTHELKHEIAKLKSCILVSENIQLSPVEPELGSSVPLDRRILRLTVSRDPTEAKNELPGRDRTSSIMGLDQDDFFRKTFNNPEQELNIRRAMSGNDNITMELSEDFSVRDTMLLDKIDNFTDLFEGFNVRNSILTNATAVRDSFALFHAEINEEKAMPSRDQLISIVKEQNNVIYSLQKEVAEKSDQIEMLKDELSLCKNNVKSMQQQLKELKRFK
jgi:hypothetical protein